MSIKPEHVHTHSASVLGGSKGVQGGDVPPSSTANSNIKVPAHSGGGGCVVNSSSSNASNASAANTFSKYNINSQFKGKSIEPQQKTNIIRQIPSGLQTLGKVVAARRMPPPSNLPSMSRSHGPNIIQTTSASSNDNNSSPNHNNGPTQTTIHQQNQNHQLNNSNNQQVSGIEQMLPVTIAAVVSGSVGSAPVNVNGGMVNGSWPTPMVASQIIEGQDGNRGSVEESQVQGGQQGAVYKTYSKTTKWGHNEFPNLADAAVINQQQTQTKQHPNQQMPSNDQNQLPNQQHNTNQTQSSNNGPLLKPSNAGNWSSTQSRQIYPTQQENAEMLLTDKQLVHETGGAHPMSNDYNNTNNNYYNNNNRNQQNNYQQQNNGQYNNNNRQGQNQNQNMNQSNNNYNRMKTNNNNMGPYNGQQNNARDSRQAYNGNAGNKMNSYQSYHNQNYSQYNESTGSTYTVPSIVKEKDFNHIEDLLINNGGSQEHSQVNGGQTNEMGMNNGGRMDVLQKNELDYGEENWAYISQNVDYNEKIQFLDDQEEEYEAEEEIKANHNTNNNNNRQPTEPESSQVKQDQQQQQVMNSTNNQLPDNEDSQYDQKRKYNDDEMKKSIERARLRRAEEERRFSEQRQAVCAEKLRQLNLKKQSQVDVGNKSMENIQIDQFAGGNDYGDEDDRNFNNVPVQVAVQPVQVSCQKSPDNNNGTNSNRGYINSSRRSDEFNYEEDQHHNGQHGQNNRQQQTHYQNQNANYPSQSQVQGQHGNKQPNVKPIKLLQHGGYSQQAGGGEFQVNGSGGQKIPKVMTTANVVGFQQQQVNVTTSVQRNTKKNDSQAQDQTKSFKHLSQNLPEVESKMQSLSKKQPPLTTTNKPTQHNEVVFNQHSQKTTPTDNNVEHNNPATAKHTATKHLDQWSTNRLQQIIKSDQQENTLVNNTGGGNAKQHAKSVDTRNTRNGKHQNNEQQLEAKFTKRERNGISESSSSVKSVKTNKRPQNTGQIVSSKESSEEPSQSSNLAPQKQQNTSNRQQANKPQNNNQRLNNNQRNSNYPSNTTNTNQQYQQRTTNFHRNNNDLPIQTQKNNNHVPRSEEDEYEDDYSDSEDTQKDTQGQQQQNQQVRNSNGNYGNNTTRQHNGGGGYVNNNNNNNNNQRSNGTNKRSVNIVSPASNFRRGGNANSNINRDFVNPELNNNVNAKRTNNNSQNNRNNNTYSDNYAYDNSKNQIRTSKSHNQNDNGGYYNADKGQPRNQPGYNQRDQRYTNGNVGSVVVSQTNLTQANLGVSHQEVVANLSASNSMHSDNKSTRSNRHSAGKHDALTNDEWETASDSSTTKPIRTEKPQVQSTTNPALAKNSTRTTENYPQKFNKDNYPEGSVGNGNQRNAVRTNSNVNGGRNGTNVMRNGTVRADQRNSNLNGNGNVHVDKVVVKLDDPRYTAKYWTSSGADNNSENVNVKQNNQGNKTVNLCC